jgi:sensor histidine kinase YesM
MVVINKIKQRNNQSKGGIGLSNMRKRLDLLLTEKFEITNRSDENEYYSSLTIQF